MSKTYDLWEDKKNFNPIYNAIEQLNNRKVKLVKIPYWYLRIVVFHNHLKIFNI